MKRCSECEKKRNKNNNNNNNPSNVFSSIQEIFHLNDVNYFNKNYEVSTVRLIYPSTIEHVKKLKRCVLACKTKGSSRMVALKLEAIGNSARSSTDIETHRLDCKGTGIPEDKRAPTEHFINTLMNGHANFNAYYPDLSGYLATSDKNIKIVVYVSDFKEGSADLQGWSEKNQGKLVNGEYEKKLKGFYRQIYSALNVLKENHYVYTDFKTQNVLIDNENKPYLIDLESVIYDDMNKPCILTPVYFPSSLDYTNNNKDDIHNRILSWTFCFSIYESMCVNFKDREMYAKIDQKKKNWPGNSFLSHFGCKKRDTIVSDEFKELIDNCLTKKIEKDSFKNLANNKWIGKVTSKGKTPKISMLKLIS